MVSFYLNDPNKGDIENTQTNSVRLVRFKPEDITSFRTTIWEKLPEFTTTPMVGQIDLVNFATRIQLITTVFAKIYEILQVDPVVKTRMDTIATTYVNAAYDVNTVALPGGGAGAGAGAAGGAFTRFFKTFIIEGGMASQSFINAAAATIPSTSKVDVELSMHYTGPTTEGSSKLFDAVKTTPEDIKKMELFFTEYLNAKKEEEFKGGFRRRRNRKSSKRRSQKKSSKRRGKSRRSKRGKRIRRKSHRK